MLSRRCLAVCLRFSMVCGFAMTVCPTVHAADEFRRGDANIDGRVDFADAFHLLLHASGIGEIRCADAADANDDGMVGPPDTVTILMATITGTATIPPPGALVCGTDPAGAAGDALDCVTYADDICTSPPAVPSVGTFELSLHAAARFDGAPGDRFPVSVILCHESSLGAISVVLSVSGGRVISATASPAFVGSEISFAEDKVLFGWFSLTELAANASPDECSMPSEVFSFEIEMDLGRDTCSFAFVDGLTGPGLPVHNRVFGTGLSESSRPTTRGLTVPYCIGSSVACPPSLELEVETTLPMRDGKIFAVEGESIDLDVFVTLDNLAPALVEAWTLSIGGLGNDIDFEDSVCQLPCQETLIGSGFDLTLSRDERVDPILNRQGPGLVGLGILNNSTPLPEGRFRIAHFRTRLTVPDVDVGPTDLLVFFKNGFEVGSGTPSVNSVTLAPGDALGIADGVGISGVSLTLVPVQDLELGVTVDVAIDSTSPERYFRLPSPSAGSSLIVTVADGESRDRQAVFLGWGTAPSTLVHDQVTFEDDSNQVMVIPEAAGLDAYFLVQGREYDGTANSLAVTIVETDLEVTSMTGSASAAGDGATLSVRVDGVGFTDSTVFSLHPASGLAPLMPSDVVLVSSRRVDLVFDLTSASGPEVFDLHADDVVLGLSSVLPAVFEVLPPPAVGSVTQLDVRGGRVYRFNWLYTMTLVVRNLGDLEVPAPLLRVRGILDPVEPCVVPTIDCQPNNLTAVFTQMKLRGEPSFHVDRDLFVLGVDRGGFAGRLPAGAEIEIPVTYQSTHCRSCMARFEVSLFTPRAFDFIGWDVMTPPVGTEAVWDDVWPQLSTTLGASWLDLNRSLADLATRLSYRDFPVESVQELVRIAVREVLGRPSVAIVGTVKDSLTRAPVAGAEIYALIGSTVHSFDVTDSEGRFAIDWLRDDTTYRLDLADHAVVAPSSDTVVIAEDASDVLGLELLVEPAAPSGHVASCLACDESDLPDESLPFPDDLFTPFRNFDIDIVSSYDPNEKEGPEGDDDDFTSSVEYTIRFQNDPEEATAAVRTVRVVELLDANLFDLDSFVPGPVQVAGYEFPALVDAFSSSSGSLGASSYQVDVTDSIVVRDTGDCVGIENCGDSCTVDCSGPVIRTEIVNVTFSWYRDTAPVTDPGPCLLGAASGLNGLAVWEFTTLGIDPEGGFLPPDDCCSQGTGSVQFSINLTAAAQGQLVGGEPVENDACIFFDPELAVTTGDLPNFGCATDHEITVTPTGLPDAPTNVAPLDLSTDQPVPVTLSWLGGPEDSFDVYVWTGTELDRPGSPTASTDDTFLVLAALDAGVEYFWQIVAIDEENDTTDGDVWSSQTLADNLPPQIPMNPIPPDVATGLPRELNLSWEAPGAAAYCVSIWAIEEDVLVDMFEVSGIVNNLLENVELDGGEPYVWQVTAMNDAGAVTGPEWTFTTAELDFERGDIDESGLLNITDAINSLVYQFLGSYNPRCLEAADVDDSGLVDINDPIALLLYLFLGTYTVPAPLEVCGTDPTADTLSCAAYSPCE